MEQQGTAPATVETSVETTRKIRAELNLEQWSIWQPSNSNREAKPRILKREIETPNGKLVAEVEITASHRGTLTTEDQKTYYALIEHHQKNKRQDNIVYFSLRSLSKSLAKKWGSRTIETLTDSLARLRANTLVWRNSYHNSESGRTDDTLDFFNIITDLKIITAKDGAHITRAEGYFKLNDAIIANLERNLSKPVLLDVVLSFKSEVAQILYTQLDRILSRDITSYKKRTKELFEDLGLEGKKYIYPAGRKQTLEPAIAEIENAPLSNGLTIASVKLEKTADGKDYKLVAKRGRAKAKFATLEPRSSEGQENPHSKEERPLESRTEAKTEPAEANQQGFELIAYFYQVFFGADKPTAKPAQKHRDLADAIVSQHGEAVSRYVVEFAKAEAEKTNFQIATFGAIANYVDRAVAGYTLQQAEIKRQQEREREEKKNRADERKWQERQQLGYQLFNDLPEEESKNLLSRFRMELITNDTWKDKDFNVEIHRSIFDSTVKAAAREHLLEIHDAESGTIREA